MNEDDRPDPDQLLAEHWRDGSQPQTGRLVLFLGMCPGVGKTYAMLKAAHQRRQEGVSVVAGIVETHGRAETAVLLEELEEIPRFRREHRGHSIGEFDLDAVLRRRPQLVLVDELAHTNVPGSRHAKRYQDVQELLAAGIDVYTTLNVQHIESQVDTVRQITGVTITETVPDSILDEAQEIQLIDLRVPQLLERLAEGKVYQGERAAQAAEGFFREANLTALRELALRFTAEHVDRDLEEMRRRRRVSSPWKTSARLMVGVGPSPYSESLVRWTRRAATRLGCPWLVVWVEGSRVLNPEEQTRLANTLGLARRLGAEVVSVTDESVSTALLRTARERNVTQIVVGKPGRFRWWRASLADLLIRDSGDIDICVVRPLISGHSTTASPGVAEVLTETAVVEYSSVLAASFVLVSVAWGMAAWLGYMAVGLLFLLGVILASLRLSRGPVLLMAAGLALSWNFYFIEPKFTFHISQVHDVIMFVMFFIVAFSMGHLTTRLRQREKAERQRQRHTAALLRVTQSAALSADPAKGLAEALHTIGEMLHAGTALVVRGEDRRLPETLHRASSITPSPKEWGVIHWVYQNRQAAGRFTGTLPESAATWFPLETATALLGVFGVQLRANAVMDFGMRQAIEAFALQLALVLEKEHFIQAVKHADLLAQSEQLQRTLLDSVSHELKTPLAVIQASLEGLAERGDEGGEDEDENEQEDEDEGEGEGEGNREEEKASGKARAGKTKPKQSPYLTEIRTASQRLQRVVNNLLQMTRIESAAVQPHREWCLVGDVVQQSLGMVGDALAGREVTVNIPAALPAVRVDSGILSQVIANILDNAAIYTPAGTGVEISVALREVDDRKGTHGREPRAPLAGTSQAVLELRIADQGPGIPEAELGRIFEKFHRLPGSPTGGTGLGLSIAQAFVRALGGGISAGNRAGGGAEFIILLPVDVLPA